MKTLEIFSGRESFSQVAKKRGHSIFTVDNDINFNPNLCKDIMEISISELPKQIDIIWASPPCQTFSVASISSYWQGGYPKNDKAVMGKAILYKTLWIIHKLKPKYWFIENPRGMMRLDGLLLYLQNRGAIRRTVTYCQYGDTRMKPTDIWTNCKEWISRKPCKSGSTCHDYQPRSHNSKKDNNCLSKGTQGLKGPIERSIIPPALLEEIFDIIEGNYS